MKILTAAILLLSAATNAAPQGVPVPVPGVAPPPTPPAPITRVEECDFRDFRSAWHPDVRRSDKNTLVINHRDLMVEGNDPYVLSVDDGGYFQVLFKCTAPAFFNYTITGDPAAQPDSAGGRVLPESVVTNVPLTTRGVTMRHDARFVKYRVTARLRDGVGQPAGMVAPGRRRPGDDPSVPQQLPEVGAKPTERPSVELFSMEFDIWVKTRPDWRLGIIAGVARSSLVDKKYAIKTDANGVKTFQEDTSQDSLQLDTMALANVYYTRTFARTFNPGIAVGLGTSGTAPRLFVGPSVVFGRFFVLHGGWVMGSVAAPPKGQDLNAPPINGDNTLNSLSSRRTSRGYIGVGFTWIDRRDQFAAALSAAASASGVVGTCVTSVKPDAVTFDEKGAASGTVTVEAGPDCLWYATLQSGVNQFSIGGGSAKGNGTIKLSTTEAVAGGRSDVLNVIGPLGSAAKTVKLTQGPKSCVESVGSGKDVSFGGKTEPQTVAVKAAAGCVWEATVDPVTAGFKVEKADDAVKITPPEPGEKEIKATLVVTGPAGSSPVKIALVQAKK